MKKIKFIFAILFSAVMMITSFNSCKKVDTTPPPTPMGTLMFHIHTDIDTTECDSGTIATDASGRKFQLNIAQLYISNVTLKKMDGTTYQVKGAYIMKYIAEEAYVVGQVPAGNYSSVSFDVGIDGATNGTNPSSYSASSPLSPQTPSMWFGSTSQGYMFVNVQGLADTTASHTGAVNYPFSYQLGTSTELKHVDMPEMKFMVLTGQTQFVHLIADYGVLLQGINFKTQNMGDPFTNVSVATQVANNIPQMFHYEM